MWLSEVLSGVDVVDRRDDADVAITHVTHDSRQVRPGSLFCCVRGEHADGHRFAPAARTAGAVAFLCDHEIDDVGGAPQIIVADVRRAMAPASAAAWGWPARSLRMAAVTGTNGKTTTVAMLGAIAQAHGWKAATIGTLTSARTTPEAPDLQAALAAQVADGVVMTAMEVSSHAIGQARVDAIVFDVAAFTNLNREHLEIHGTMEAYFEAKAQLFTPERTRRAVICTDDEWGMTLADRATHRGVPVVTCSGRDAIVMSESDGETRFTWRGHEGVLRLRGAHNLTDAVIAATVADQLGVAPRDALEGLAQLQTVPGHAESVDVGQPFAVVVDFAHTPAAVEAALLAARAQTASGRVIVVLGCGGDRDRGKRPLMAAVAERLADGVVLTSDNPRSEDPRAILEEMRSGLLSPRGAILEVDRRVAIHAAVADAAAGDVVVIAGKGHETTQTIGDDVFPFDDRVVAREALAARGYQQGGPIS